MRARRNDGHPTRYFSGVSYVPYEDVGEVKMTSMSDAAVRDELWQMGVLVARVKLSPLISHKMFKPQGQTSNFHQHLADLAAMSYDAPTQRKTVGQYKNNMYQKSARCALQPSKDQLAVS